MSLSIAIESSNCLAYSSQLDKSLVINCCWTNLAPCESTTSSGRLCPLSVSCELLYTKFSNTPSSVAAIGNSLWCSCCDGVIYNVGNTSVIGHNAVSGTHKCTCELVSQIPLSVGLPMRKIDIRAGIPRFAFQRGFQRISFHGLAICEEVTPLHHHNQKTKLSNLSAARKWPPFCIASWKLTRITGTQRGKQRGSENRLKINIKPVYSFLFMQIMSNEQAASSRSLRGPQEVLSWADPYIEEEEEIMLVSILRRYSFLVYDSSYDIIVTFSWNYEG